MTATFDLAVAGSGFAGSLMALIGRRLGLSVVLLEKTQHPRVVIGESSTPLSNLLLEDLAERYDLPWLKPFAKWGSWQEVYPEVGCGLKRGFTFFHHEPGSTAASPVDRQMLVAASPHDAIADTHWFRADVDAFLAEQAKAAGAWYIDHCTVRSVRRDGQTWQLACDTGAGPRMIQARMLVDATGPHGLLHRHFALHNVGYPSLPETAALYSHFAGVRDFAGAQHYKGGAAPYPADAAALHHVFPGGWMWVLRFNQGWTSAGVAATPPVARAFDFAQKEAAWSRLLATLPEVKAQFASAKARMPFTHVPQLAFRSSCLAGEGWAMLPSTAGFVDPLLSTGFALTLLGLLRLGEILERHEDAATLQQSLDEYGRRTEGELLATADLISALYANMGDFVLLRRLLLLYFAAASYAETVRRLGKPAMADAFLLHTDPEFGPALRRLTARARLPLQAEERAALQGEILALVDRYDVAGLTSEPTDHCYPVRADDLFAGAAKVRASRSEIEELLRRAGFA